MNVSPPKLNHSIIIYTAIIHEHGADSTHLAYTLQALGWTLGDAAWASVNWSQLWLAATIANIKDERGIKPHSLSSNALARIRAELAPTELSKAADI